MKASTFVSYGKRFSILYYTILTYIYILYNYTFFIFLPVHSQDSIGNEGQYNYEVTK